ncbi:MAG: protein kinase [Deltaproteobacteria bacterium]|nr:protein kinase [Deltaproteobacteria bacterium]
MTGTSTRARWTPASVTSELTAPPPTDELAPGAVVGDYVIERQLGAGGMGIVYGARHPIIGKRAAIKVLNARYSADPDAVGRFVQEAQAVNQIGHDSIVDIFAFGTLPDGRVFLVMEWLQGESLQARLERDRVPLPETLAILGALARALQDVHAADVVHRDLKPDNVFLLEGGESPRIKLLDFGIAKLSSGSPTINRTQTGVVMGTPLFMSPEQARGDHIDARTDLYALGVIAYHLVCGETPFGSEPSAIEILAAHICKAPPMPTALQPDTPPALEALILGLLAKNPAERPALVDVRRQLADLAARPSAQTMAPIGMIAPTEPMVAMDSNPSIHPLDDSSDNLRPAVRGGPSSAISIIRLAAAPPKSRKKPAILAWAGAAAVALGAIVFAVVTQLKHSAAPAASDARAPRTVAATTRPAGSPPRLAPAPPPAAAPIEAPDAIGAPTAPTSLVPATGTLDLVLDPPTATVAIDGRAIQPKCGRSRLALAPGEHTLEVTARGRRTIAQAVTITSDETTTLKLHLERKKRASHGGRGHTPDVDGVLNPFARK